MAKPFLKNYIQMCNMFVSNADLFIEKLLKYFQKSEVGKVVIGASNIEIGSGILLARGVATVDQGNQTG